MVGLWGDRDWVGDGANRLAEWRRIAAARDRSQTKSTLECAFLELYPAIMSAWIDLAAATWTGRWVQTKYVFVDESGCLTFNRERNVSKYFIVCTITMDNCQIEGALLDLRRRLILDGNHQLGDCFHASHDKQSVRDAVFAEILKYEYHIQASIFDKPKAGDDLRGNSAKFYEASFYSHLKHAVPETIQPNVGETHLLTAASIGTARERNLFQNAVKNALKTTVGNISWKTDFVPATSNPCLQVADYCAWAIYRKWERGDLRSYELIKDRITHEHDVWKDQTITYY